MVGSVLMKNETDEKAKGMVRTDNHACEANQDTDRTAPVQTILSRDGNKAR